MSQPAMEKLVYFIDKDGPLRDVVMGKIIEVHICIICILQFISPIEIYIVVLFQ
jgi:hypothetical protein